MRKQITTYAFLKEAIMADLPLNDDKAAKIAQAKRDYGIEHTPVDYFHIDGYRYTDLNDALAQARRAKPTK
jgi:hypothetical protein